jgi:outer membrane biosynthesis protein TonB
VRNPGLLLLAGLALAFGPWVSTARADIIHLTNGRSIKGRVTSRSGGRTHVQLDNGGRLILPSNQIDSVEQDEQKPPTTRVVRQPIVIEEPEPPEESPEDVPVKPPATGTGTTEPGKGPELDLAAIERQATELAPRIKELINTLGTEGANNEDKRSAAREELAKMGEPAVGLLVETLRDQSLLRQELAAGAISAIGSKRAAKPLLAALDAATPKEGKETPGGIAVLNAMASAFNRVTGQSFAYDARDIPEARVAIVQMQAWWQVNADKFPAQIGDPPKEPKEPKPGSTPPEGTTPEKTEGKPPAPAEPAAPGAPEKPAEAPKPPAEPTPDTNKEAAPAKVPSAEGG